MSGDRPPKTTHRPDPPAARDRPQSDETEEGFLRRWSRRKHADGPHEGPSEEPTSRTLESTPSRAEAATDVPETAAGDAPVEEVLTDVDMPPLASLNTESDYSGFFSPGVSEKLRRAALRKLFSSPMFNVVDGLDDYDEDFRSFEALGDIITSDMRGQMERELERREAAKAAGSGGADVAQAPGSHEPDMPELSDSPPAAEPAQAEFGEAELDERPETTPGLEVQNLAGSGPTTRSGAAATPGTEIESAAGDAQSTEAARQERNG